ncbi:MAG: DUF362 domain-containing protein [Victivallaceae bacterium]|nr:DUF362 domain-containing protein [Victivallaceae bacterium]
MKSSELLFGSFAPKTLDPAASFGNKFSRILDALDLAATVRDKKVCIKMHLGGGGGFSTIHPFFVRKLVAAVRKAGAASVFVTDLYRDTIGAIDRGYTEEVFGCPIIPVCNEKDDNYRSFPVTPAFQSMDRIELSAPILASDVLLDFSHIKGHGVCGFGGASKNLSMGAVTDRMRQILHSLEGGLEWDEAKCIHCNKCVDNCPNHAMSFKENKLDVFYHNCKFCQHCALICPTKAVKMTAGGYLDFQKGMAMTSAKLLEAFLPDRALFINMLMDVTIFCDCWGMTTPRLIRDIGVLAGRDIVAIEEATLDLIGKEKLIEGSLPPGRELDMDESKHLFERIHHKDPYAVVRYLEELGCGTRRYHLTEID